MTAPSTNIDLYLCPGPIQEFDLLLCPRTGAVATGQSFDRLASESVTFIALDLMRVVSVSQTSLASVDNIDHLAFPAISSYTRLADADHLMADSASTQVAFQRRSDQATAPTADTAERRANYLRETTQGADLAALADRRVLYVRPLATSTDTEVSTERSQTVNRSHMLAEDLLDTTQRTVDYVREHAAQALVEATADRSLTVVRSTSEGIAEDVATERTQALSHPLFMGQGMGIEVARQVDYVRENAEDVAEDVAPTGSLALARTSSDTIPQQQDSAQRDYTARRRVGADLLIQAEAERSLATMRLTSQSTALTDLAVRTTLVSRSVDAALVLLPVAARRVAFRRRPAEALAGLAADAARTASYARLPRRAEVAFGPSPAASRQVSYARLALTEQAIQDALAYGSWNTSRTAYDAQVAQDAVATQHLDLKRIARDVTLVGHSASRVAHVSRRSNEYMAFVGSARRQVAYRRFTEDAVAEQGHEATRRAAFPRHASEFVPLSAATERTSALSRSTREVLESHAVARRTAAMSRLGAERIATEDTTSRSLTVIRLGSEEFGVIGDSAARSALVSRSATEVTSTDLVVTRTLAYTRLLTEALGLLATPFSTSSYSRLVEDVVDFIEDVATRERLYLTPTQRFPQSYDLDLGAQRVYDLSLTKERTMVLDQSVAPAYDLTANHAEVLVVESGTGLWIVLTTDTEGEA